MAVKTIRDWAQWLFRDFPPITLTWGSRIVYAIAAVADTIVEGYQTGMACRFIQVCPYDALPYHGRDRRLPRGPLETDDGYRARLLDAHTAWGLAGSSAGLKAQLEHLGYVDPSGAEEIVILTNADWEHEYDENVDEWWRFRDLLGKAYYDYGAPNRFWVIVPAACHNYTTAIPAADETAVARCVREWRAGEDRCVAVIFLVGDTWLADYGCELTFDQIGAGTDPQAMTCDEYQALYITEGL